VNELIPRDASLAHVSAGRWCAFCSSPHCDEAVEFESVKPPVYPKFMPAFQCWACGHKTEVIWPSAEMVHGIERLLLLRRNPNNQNWRPDETLVDLHQENMLHGVYDFLPTSGLPSGKGLLMVSESHVVADLLPELNPRRELRAVTR
jgi:hypothetical protein